MDWKTATEKLNERTTNSGSETSENEMDFGKLNEKYRDWSAQHRAQKRREENKNEKMTELLEKKKELNEKSTKFERTNT